MRILICDDENAVLKQLEQMIHLYDESFDVVSTNGAEDILEITKQDKHVRFDVLIMDIMLKDENGIDLAVFLSALFPNIKVIFMTAHQQYVQDIFLKIKPYAYLSKPIKQDVLFGHMENIQHELIRPEETIEITSNNKKFRIKQSEICYIESDRKKTNFVTIKGQYLVYAKLNDVKSKLNKKFVRCHQSYIVNLDYVQKMNDKEFILFSGKRVAISRTKRLETVEIYHKFAGGINVDV